MCRPCHRQIFKASAFGGSPENLEKIYGSEVEVVQLIVKEPSETAFPVTDVIARADAKGAARARIALTKQYKWRTN
jgi:hypothetical protein